MQFKIHFEQKINRNLYEDYCDFLLDEVRRSIRRQVDRRKYKVREKYVLESRVMRWIRVPPKTINLAYYVENCIQMVKVKGEYVIRVNPRLRVRHSKTKVKTLIRLLEYGNEIIPPYPVVRRVLRYYSVMYPHLLIDFIRERMLR